MRYPGWVHLHPNLSSTPSDPHAKSQSSHPYGWTHQKHENAVRTTNAALRVAEAGIDDDTARDLYTFPDTALAAKPQHCGLVRAMAADGDVITDYESGVEHGCSGRPVLYD